MVLQVVNVRSSMDVFRQPLQVALRDGKVLTPDQNDRVRASKHVHVPRFEWVRLGYKCQLDDGFSRSGRAVDVNYNNRGNRNTFGLKPRISQ